MKPLRRKSNITGIIIVVLLAISIILAVLAVVSYRGEVREKIAVMSLQGIIISGETDEEGYVSSARFSETLYQLKDDEGVKAIVIVVNSPGGTPSASYEIAKAIEDVKKTKPVIAFLGDIATSGAYYAISPSTKIVSLPDTVTGSLGIIWVIENKEGHFEEEGIRYFVYKSGEMKDLGAPWREPTPEEEKLINSTVEEIFNRMMDEISSSRNLSSDVVAEISDARIFTGYKALELGLVDDIGTYHTAIEMAKSLSGAKSPVIQHIEPRDFENVTSKYLEKSFSGYPLS